LKQINFTHFPLKLFVFGFTAFILFWYIIFYKVNFFHTFEHEITHILAGLLFLKKPAEFWVRENVGGAVQLYGNNFVIQLAPYFLPTLSFLLLPLSLLIQPQYLPYYFLILGFFTSYHIISTLHEFSYNQPDIQHAGKIFSTVFLMLMNVICYGVLLAFVLGSFEGSVNYLESGLLFAIDKSDSISLLVK
jgi:hypothetical protein